MKYVCSIGLDKLTVSVAESQSNQKFKRLFQIRGLQVLVDLANICESSHSYWWNLKLYCMVAPNNILSGCEFFKPEITGLRLPAFFFQISGYLSIGTPPPSSLLINFCYGQESVKLPSSAWQWTGDWIVDYHTPGGVDRDGWQACLNIYQKWLIVLKKAQLVISFLLYRVIY